MNSVPFIQLNDGHNIPQLGLGTFQIDPSDTKESVLNAFRVGYRHIDTAEMYRNEAEVGEALKESGLTRSEVFITSKLNNGFHEQEAARTAFQETLKKLDIEYIDLFLIHWPLPTLYNGDYLATWSVLEEFHAAGTAKSIGVSNFQVEYLEKLLADSDVVPAVNQIELHPYLRNQKVADYCNEQGIAIEAWSPIAKGNVLTDKVIITIANELNKTPAQVALRWHIQHEYIVFPKSVTESRIQENFEIFDFELTDVQMSRIDTLDKGESGRTGPNPDTFDYVPE